MQLGNSPPAATPQAFSDRVQAGHATRLVSIPAHAHAAGLAPDRKATRKAPRIGLSWRRQITPSLAGDAWPLLMGLVALALWDASGIDQVLVHLFGNAQGFAWRNHWLTSTVLHSGAQYLAWGLLATLLLSLRWPTPLLRRLTRRERLWWLGTTLACVALIPLLKRHSATSCPWDLAEFGGRSMAHHVPHWVQGQRDGGPGGCFPSGHASSAFAFLAGVFALRRRAPRAATAGLMLITVAGLALGWVQMMRGAHYASHSLWTAWICWAVAVMSFHALRPWREAERSTAPATVPVPAR